MIAPSLPRCLENTEGFSGAGSMRVRALGGRTREVAPERSDLGTPPTKNRATACFWGSHVELTSGPKAKHSQLRNLPHDYSRDRRLLFEFSDLAAASIDFNRLKSPLIP